LRLIAGLDYKTNRKLETRNKTVLKNSNVGAKVIEITEKTSG
jgi:hypothetical protein